MSIIGCGNRIPCVISAFIASVIVGVATAFLRFAGIINITPTFYWVALGIAVVYLLVYLIVSSQNRKDLSCRYACANITGVITGILGAIITSLILLATEPVITSIIGAILIGLLLFFLSLLITSTACIVKCGYACD